MSRCENVFKSADILIPKTDLEKWSVIACDQYTSEPGYWEDVEREVCGRPSSFNIIFPEVYLEESDVDARIRSINLTMQKYIDEDVFKLYRDIFVYVRRHLANGKVRKGIVGVLDLEEYDFREDSKSLIRATEGTVISRIPPRVKVRADAQLETPHIMVLIDDEKMRAVEQFEDELPSLDKLYDFKLMQNGGSIEGYAVSGDNKNRVYREIERLYNEKSAADSSDVLLFAMGDGNHSFATAKTCWETIKKGLSKQEAAAHPARYALCEVVNIHDGALDFEPIHRVLFGCDAGRLTEEFLKFYGDASERDNGGHRIEFLWGDKSKVYYVKNSKSNLPAGTLQNFLDFYISKFAGKIDYIHGEEAVKSMASFKGNVGFLLPAIDKSQFFETVILDGVLPRKTFSMGEANDKRYYLECRKIK